MNHLWWHMELTQGTNVLMSTKVMQRMWLELDLGKGRREKVNKSFITMEIWLMFFVVKCHYSWITNGQILFMHSPASSCIYLLSLFVIMDLSFTEWVQVDKAGTAIWQISQWDTSSKALLWGRVVNNIDIFCNLAPQLSPGGNNLSCQLHGTKVGFLSLFFFLIF